MSMENGLPKGWVKENLAKCLEKVIDYRGKTPKKANDGILTLSAKSVKMGYIDYSEAYFISKSTYDSFMVRGFPKKGDILMTTEAPLGCIAKLDRDNVGVAQRLLTLRGKKGVLNNDYLKYYLTSRIGQHELLSRASGTTVQGIRRTEFEKVNIIRPPYEEQKAIASILTSFDDKIELLQAQNETLENIAQTIFKEWFGKYKVGDELPEGWRVGKLGDVVKTINTGADAIKKAPIVDYNTGIKCLRIGDLSNNRPFDQWGYTKITDNFFKQFQLKKYDILVTRTSVLGLNKLILEDMNAVYNNGLIKLSLIEGVNPFYIYGYFRSKYYENYISMINNDTSTRPNMKIEYLLKFPILLSTEGIESKFSDIMGSLLWKVYYNTQQIQTLQATRDTLLPKLMSGQLRVNEFKEQICEVV